MLLVTTALYKGMKVDVERSWKHLIMKIYRLGLFAGSVR